MHRIVISLIILLASSICFGTNVYIDTDVVGGTGDGSSWTNAYSTTAAAVTAKAGVLTEDINFYARASSNTHDTAPITVSGYTQGVYYINFYFDSSYELDVTNDIGILVTGNTTHIRINGFNCNVTETGTGNAYGISFSSMSVDTNNVYVSNCRIIGDCNGTGEGCGVCNRDNECQRLYISNCVISGFISGSDSGFVGINGGISSSCWCYIYNSTISNCYYGIRAYPSSPLFVTNSVSFNNSSTLRDIFEGTQTVTYTATDKTISGTGNIDWANGATDWAANFTDYANNDYTIKDINADIYHSGTDVGLSTDITGYAWYATPSIGAYEFQESSGTPPVRKPRIININMN